MTRALYVLSALIALATAMGGASTCLAQDTIRLGMSADFNGPARELGIDLYRGAALYLDEVNRTGGVHGRMVEVVAMDDGYAPDPAIANTVKLVERHNVFALFNYVGTPTTTRILPLLKRYERRGIPLLFPLTGATPLRRPPYDRYVYNLRASYADEASALVNAFLDAGRTRIALLYQVDSFGRSVWAGVRAALAEHGLFIAGEATYRRGAQYDTDMAAQAKIIAKTKPDAVIIAGTSMACAAFVRDARDAGIDAPMASLSFASAQEVLELLGAEENPRYTENFIGSLVVPITTHAALPALHEFDRLMRAHVPTLPEGLAKSGVPPFALTPAAFEGFLNAKFLVEVLRRLGPDLARDRLDYVMRKTGDFDLGIGVPLRFPKGGNQALQGVYFVTIDKGALSPLADFGRWHR